MKLSLNLFMMICSLATSAFSFEGAATDNHYDLLQRQNSAICENDNCEGAETNVIEQALGVKTDAIIKYYAFEEFSDKLNESLEEEFDAFAFINTAEGNPRLCNSVPLAIPSQFGRIIWKKNTGSQTRVFTRDENKRIIGLIPGSFRQVEGLSSSFETENKLHPKVNAFLAANQGLNYFPVSTGTIRNVAKTMTPSGIFGLDTSYMNFYRKRTDTNPFEHMPYTILADARYGDNYQNRKFAFGIHGTPEIFINCKKSFPNGLTINSNCPPCPASATLDPSTLPKACINTNSPTYLGIKRDSSGCIRTHLPTSKVISQWLWEHLQASSVPVLNPNVNIPSPGLPSRRASGFKMLLIPFSGYKPQTCI